MCFAGPLHGAGLPPGLRCPHGTGQRRRQRRLLPHRIPRVLAAHRDGETREGKRDEGGPTIYILCQQLFPAVSEPTSLELGVPRTKTQLFVAVGSGGRSRALGATVSLWFWAVGLICCCCFMSFFAASCAFCCCASTGDEAVQDHRELRQREQPHFHARGHVPRLHPRRGERRTPSSKQ